MNTPVPTVISGIAGGQGEQFARVIGEMANSESPKAKLVACVEGYGPNKRRAEELARKWGVRDCPVFSTIEEAIRKVPFEFAVSATLPQEHERETVALLNADKVVLCEKPPTVDLDGMRNVIRAERRSRGWVAYNFHLDAQTSIIESIVRRREIGSPLMIRTEWIRTLVTEEERAAMERAGRRRGQPTAGPGGRPPSPMDDLCHIVRALLKFFPLGAKIEAVRGHSWLPEVSLEHIKATVSFPWVTDVRQGDARVNEARQTRRAHISATAGWDIPAITDGSSDRANLKIQGARGSAEMNFLLDNGYGVGDQVPAMYYPRVKRVLPDGKIGTTIYDGPQPLSPWECLRKKTHDVVSFIIADERPVKPADGGRDVMALLEALQRSEREGREVDVQEINI